MKPLNGYMKCQKDMLFVLDKLKVHPRESNNSALCRMMFGTTEL